MQLSLNEIITATGAQILNPHAVCKLPITSVSTDTRTITQGALFVPIKGENFDGHAYIHIAAEAGALCAFTETDDVSSDIPLLKVDSTKAALMALATYYLNLHNVKVIAITGSAGKTTVKDMIASVLSERYKVKKTIGNFNNDIGMPLSIFQLEPDDEVMVLEMGMNHAGEIHVLSMAGNPDVAVITHIGDAHIENFKNREGILHAKLEVVDGLKSGGLVVLNGDDVLLTGTIAKEKLVGLNVVYPNINNIVSVVHEGLDGSICHFKLNDHDIHIKVPLPGNHMVMNALLACTVGMALSVSPQQITHGFDALIPTGGRLKVMKTKDFTLINDVYNANPASMMEALKVLSTQKGRRVAILGGMAELGHVAQARHTEVGQFAAHQGVDLFVAVGTPSLPMYEAFQSENTQQSALYFANKGDFYAQMKTILQPGDVILLKASRSMAFEEIIRAIEDWQSNKEGVCS